MRLPKWVKLEIYVWKDIFRIAIERAREYIKFFKNIGE